MSMIITSLQSIIDLGCIYTFVVVAVFLTSRVIRFDDLTVDGSFALGGALCAQLLLAKEVNPWVTMGCAFGVGALLGSITGLLHLRLGLNNLMSGIVSTTAIFSFNLKIAGPNISLHNVVTIFSSFITGMNSEVQATIVLLILVFSCLAAVSWLLKTEIGYMLKVVGDNPQMLANLGKSSGTYTLFALSLANGLTAVAGALFVQYVGFFSITGSIGTIIIALAALILSDMVDLRWMICSLFIGAILYQAIIAVMLEFHMDPVWNKLLTAVLIVVLVVLKKIQTRGGSHA